MFNAAKFAFVTFLLPTSWIYTCLDGYSWHTTFALDFTVGQIHYFNFKGSQVGHSSTPLPLGDWVPFITCRDWTRKVQMLHLFTNDQWWLQWRGDLQLCCSPLFFTCNATRLGDSKRNRRPCWSLPLDLNIWWTFGRCLPWTSSFRRDNYNIIG